MNDVGIENFYIELMKECPCDCKEQLLKYEGEAIREEAPSLNHKIAGRSKQEYRAENKDKLLKYRKEHYGNNKAKQLEQKREYYKNNKDRCLEQNREYKARNKARLLIQAKDYYYKKKSEKRQISIEPHYNRTK